MPEVSSSSLTTIQSSNGEGPVANVLKSKFMTTNDIMLLRCGCLQVGISDACGQYCNSVPHGIGERDLYTFTRYHTGILGVLKIGDVMIILHPSYCVSKVHLARE